MMASASRIVRVTSCPSMCPCIDSLRSYLIVWKPRSSVTTKSEKSSRQTGILQFSSKSGCTSMGWMRYRCHTKNG
jgi:hypothetical protein